MKDVTMRTGTEMIGKGHALLHQLSHGVKGFGALPEDPKAFDFTSLSPGKTTEEIVDAG